MGERGGVRIRREAEVLALAEELFLERGYGATTIDDILVRSGLSKGGFYHYFDSKEAVLRASIDRLVQARLRDVKAMVEDPDLTGLEKLRRLVGSRGQLEQPDRETARFIGTLMQSDVALFHYYHTLAQTFLEPFAAILDQGVDEGAFQVSAPRETADLLIRAISTFPLSALYASAVDGQGVQARYATAVRELIAGAVGIRPEDLSP